MAGELLTSSPRLQYTSKHKPFLQTMEQVPNQTQPKRLSRNNRRYHFSASYPPVLSIQPGETVIVETNDARSGTIRSSADLLTVPHPDGTNPVTGPIHVAGAEPGDSLLVHVHDIVVDRQGYTAIKAGFGLMAERAVEFVTKVIAVEDGFVRFSDTIRLRSFPMIGTIGVAPESGEISCLYPGPYGGNMDNKFVRRGCVLHLPVFIPGALLFMGDVHAAMGDGEVSMVGLEIASEVTATVDLVKGERIDRPWIEYDGRWITTCDDMDPGVAMKIACSGMVALMMKRLGISFDDAYMLASIGADLAICQGCDPGRFPVTTRMSYEFATP
jgi:amidase